MYEPSLFTKQAKPGQPIQVYTSQFGSDSTKPVIQTDQGSTFGLGRIHIFFAKSNLNQPIKNGLVWNLWIKSIMSNK